MSARALAIVCILCSGLWGALLGVLHWRGELLLLDRAEASFTDIRLALRGARPAPDSVVIVAIDDRTVAAVGSYPLPRPALADLVNAIGAAGPKAIAIDILLVDRGDPAVDARLAAALAAQPVVLAAAATFDAGTASAFDEGPLAGVPRATAILQPNPLFRDAARTGLVNVVTDAGGTPRGIPLLMMSPDGLEVALPLRTVAVALGLEPELDGDLVRLGDRTVPAARSWVLPLSYYGPRGTVWTMSAASLLDGSADPALLAGRVVVVGSMVTGAGDVFPSPFEAILPGVEIHATAMANMLAGQVLDRSGRVRMLDALAAILLPMVVVGLVAWRRTIAGLLGVASVFAAFAGLSTVAFAQGIGTSMAPPLAAALPAALLFGALQVWHGRRSALAFRKQSEMLQTIQAPGMAQWLAQDPEFLRKPSKQPAAVVFVDLSGFTTLSERIGPERTRELVDGFYRITEDAVTEAGGVITSFMGDGVMILFGLPRPGATDAARALSCIMALSARLKVWLTALPGDGDRPDGFKIGGHYGPIVVSRIGGDRNQQIAATGDTVNVASRLMSAAAARNATAAISSDFRSAAMVGAVEAVGFVGPMNVSVRGRKGSVEVWISP